MLYQKRKNLYKILIYRGLNVLSAIPEGLEPPTCRTGICYSIQLNYGTKTHAFAMGLQKYEIPKLK